MQGTTVVLRGTFQFKSEAPLECLTFNFKKDDPEEQKYDYFSCKDCGVNWVCEWCRDGCHQGHTLLTHISNHRPTYACCHCVKKGLCKIKNNKNKGKV
mmetsp:Transcript_7907/g.12244  ORF Transcript_7907/g.12244 Transcript_7907/m.12244 type:complete len:98 (-) Transcript_7907:13-306(-)